MRAEGATKYRPMVARCIFLGGDHTDSEFAAK